MTTQRSNLSKARALGASHHGTDHHISHRIAAVALVPLGLWFVISLATLCTEGCGLYTFQDWLASPFNAVGTALFMLVAFYHSFLIMQVVLEDYMAHQFARITSIVFLKFAMAAGAAYGLFSLLKIALTA